MPEILAQLVLHKYKSGTSKMVDLLAELNRINPSDFDLTKQDIRFMNTKSKILSG